MNVVRNCEIKLLVKGNFKQSIMRNESEKSRPKQVQREQEIEHVRSKKLQTDRLNGTVAEVHLFHVEFTSNRSTFV